MGTGAVAGAGAAADPNKCQSIISTVVRERVMGGEGGGCWSRSNSFAGRGDMCTHATGGESEFLKAPGHIFKVGNEPVEHGEVGRSVET
jgi:hypothetical protein